MPVGSAAKDTMPDGANLARVSGEPRKGNPRHVSAVLGLKHTLEARSSVPERHDEPNSWRTGKTITGLPNGGV